MIPFHNSLTSIRHWCATWMDLCSSSEETFSFMKGWILHHLPHVATMDNFGLAIPATDLPQLVPSMFREEWRCVSMEHLEQSVMWAGTN